MAVEPAKADRPQPRRKRGGSGSRGTSRRKKKTTTSGQAAESPASVEPAADASPKKKSGSARRRRPKKKAAPAPEAPVPQARASEGGTSSAIEGLVTVAKPVPAIPAEHGAGSAAAATPAEGKKRPGRRTRRKQSGRSARSPDSAATDATVEGGTSAESPREPRPSPQPDRRSSESKRPAGRRRRKRTGKTDVAEAPPEPPPATSAPEDAEVARPEAGEGFGFGLFEPESPAAPAPPGASASDTPSEADPIVAAPPDRDAPSAAGDEEPRRASRPRRARGKRSTTSSGQDKATREAPPKQAKTARAVQPEPGSDNLQMVINVSAGDECRIAVLEGNRLEELFIERQSAESHVGSIYKGRVTNVEPSIQAVFVDFGLAKNGFLHISDVHPQYFPEGGATSEGVGKKIPRRDRPHIQKCFRRGQEVVVQVTKEGIGTKGPTLTTYLSIPGRFLVMMPGMSRLGVSRKIEDETARRSMRELLGQLDLPEGLGFILRTAGLDRTKRELQRDLTYLNRLWKIVDQRIRKVRAPAEVYQESDLVIRTIRDVLTSDFKRIVVDDEPTADKAREFLKIALPRSQDMVEVHDGHQPIFHQYGIEEEIERINARHVPLQSGGSIVVESTEAMVAIDVNSGRFRDVDDAEESAFRINLEAADEIARQLRLRDLGGLIVCDFIDMRLEKHKRAVERCLRNALRKHKERVRLLRMSAFGLIEITRQRQRTSIRRSMYTECPHCRGSGTVKSPESMALEVMRVLQLVSHQNTVRKVAVTVSPDVAFLVQNQRRGRLHELEVDTGASISIRGDAQYALDQMACECEDDRGRSITPPT